MKKMKEEKRSVGVSARNESQWRCESAGVKAPLVVFLLPTTAARCKGIDGSAAAAAAATCAHRLKLY